MLKLTRREFIGWLVVLASTSAAQAQTNQNFTLPLIRILEEHWDMLPKYEGQPVFEYPKNLINPNGSTHTKLNLRDGNYEFQLYYTKAQPNSDSLLGEGSLEI